MVICLVRPIYWYSMTLVSTFNSLNWFLYNQQIAWNEKYSEYFGYTKILIVRFSLVLRPGFEFESVYLALSTVQGSKILKNSNYKRHLYLYLEHLCCLVLVYFRCIIKNLLKSFQTYFLIIDCCTYIILDVVSRFLYYELPKKYIVTNNFLMFIKWRRTYLKKNYIKTLTLR